MKGGSIETPAGATGACLRAVARAIAAATLSLACLPGSAETREPSRFTEETSGTRLAAVERAPGPHGDGLKEEARVAGDEERARAPAPEPPRLTFLFTPECASEAEASRLASALALRYGGEVDHAPWKGEPYLQRRPIWARHDGGCGLLLFAGEEWTHLPLEPGACEDELRLTASRALFVLRSTGDSGSPRTSRPLRIGHAPSGTAPNEAKLGPAQTSPGDSPASHREELRGARPVEEPLPPPPPPPFHESPEEEEPLVHAIESSDAAAAFERRDSSPSRPAREDGPGESAGAGPPAGDDAVSGPPHGSSGAPGPSPDSGSPERGAAAGWRVSLVPGVRLAGSPAREANPFLSVNLLFGAGRQTGAVELGLLANSSSAGMNGLQAALLFNQAGGSMRGAQLSGLANLCRGSIRGVQLSGGGNVVTGSMTGAQLAGLANGAGPGSRGVQVGLFNAAGELRGLQLGLFNRAGAVSGAQLGLVNVSREADVPLGLINVVRNEPVRPVLSLSSRRFVAGGLMHGGSRLRYLYLGGRRPGSTAGTGLGMGMSLLVPGELLSLNLEAVGWQLIGLDPLVLMQLNELRLLASRRFGGRFEIYLGPSLKILRSPLRDGGSLPPPGAAERETSGGAHLFFWPEVHAGMAF